MNITNNISNIFSQKIQQAKTSCNFSATSKLEFQPSEDCFVRSTNLIKQISDKQRIEKLYDETYNQVINLVSKTNPIIKDLQLNKPQIIIKEYSDSKTCGAYSFIDNTISISKDVFDISSYIIGTVDKDGNIEKYLGLTSEKEKQEKLKKAQQLENNAEVIKLSKEEQDIYVKSVFAHEIRHFIQEHLIASTEGCGQLQKDGINNFLKQSKDEVKKAREEYINLCKEMGIEADKNLIKEDKKYYETYQPKTNLPADTKLKFSLFSDDNRYWSVKDHLLKSELDTSSGKGINEFDDDYYSNALEVDAYNFEKEFLYFYANDNKNVRKNVILSFTFKPEEYCSRGIELMNKKGTDFITQ